MTSPGGQARHPPLLREGIKGSYQVAYVGKKACSTSKCVHHVSRGLLKVQ